jgi:putative acetyltransferase
LSAFEGEAEAQLVGELRKSSAFIPDLSLVAELHDRIVGHVVLSKVALKTSQGRQEILALGPMSVVPSQSHRGIGSELIEAAVARAKALCYGAIVIAGHPDYYLRFGFKPAADFGMTSNLPIPSDALTAMELTAGALGGGGEVLYPDLFRKLF